MLSKANSNDRGSTIVGCSHVGEDNIYHLSFLLRVGSFPFQCLAREKLAPTISVHAALLQGHSFPPWHCRHAANVAFKQASSNWAGIADTASSDRISSLIQFFCPPTSGS